MKSRDIGVLALTAVLISPAWAQQYVYPATGQSPDQQQAAFAKASAACLEGKGHAVR